MEGSIPISPYSQYPLFLTTVKEHTKQTILITGYVAITHMVLAIIFKSNVKQVVCLGISTSLIHHGLSIMETHEIKKKEWEAGGNAHFQDATRLIITKTIHALIIFYFSDVQIRYFRSDTSCFYISGQPISYLWSLMACQYTYLPLV